MASDKIRLVSLDAFRGFTIAAMLLVNNPGDWNNIYPPLAHAEWSGWTFTDCIFPFFLFIAGVSLHISVANNPLLLISKRLIYAQICRRAIIIFFIGLTLNFIPLFDLSSMRIPGVLQRIALCIVLAAPIVIFFTWEKQCIWILALLSLYTSIMLFLPSPDFHGVWGVGILEPGKDVGAWLDRFLMDGHLWKKSKTWDPEGLLSTLPATCSLLFGALTGRLLLGLQAPHQKCLIMLAIGSMGVIVGQIMDLYVMPINESLWSSSYSIFMTGWALIAFSLFYYLLDTSKLLGLKEKTRFLCLPLIMYGVNALFIFSLSGLIAKIIGFIQIQNSDGMNHSLQKAIYSSIKALPISAMNSSLLFAILFNFFMLTIAFVMWKKRWFFKV